MINEIRNKDGLRFILVRDWSTLFSYFQLFFSGNIELFEQGNGNENDGSASNGIVSI